MENDNKRTLILSIIGILVLVIAVVGVSFAMYTFTGTGTKVNQITTGSVSLSFNDDDDNSFTLDSSYPMTDEEGTDATDNEATFEVNANWGSTAMTVYYDLGVELVNGYTLDPSYVKFNLRKGDNYILGTESTGVVLGDYATVKGPNKLIEEYGLTGGTFTSSEQVDSYTIKAWVASNYPLAVDKANSTAPEVTDGALPNEDGTLHKKATKSQTISFKLKLVASQTQGA